MSRMRWPLASRCRPDLMIVDVGLGEASGIVAVKEILRSGFVPHVFVTGDTMSSVPYGPETILIQKPFRVPDLELANQRALAAAPVATRSLKAEERIGG